MNLPMMWAAACLFPAALPAQDRLETRTATPPGPGRSDLQVEWKAPFLPDGTSLTVQLARLEERFRGGVLEPQEIPYGGGLGHAKGGVIFWKGPIPGPGSFRATLTLLADLQGGRALQALKDTGVTLPQKWRSDFDALGDDLAARLEPALREFDGLAARTTTLLQRCAEASASRQAWREKVRTVEEDARQLMEEVGRSPAGGIFTAAMARLTAGTDVIFAATRCVRFGHDGKLQGFLIFENPQDPLLRFEGEPFGWETHLRKIGDIKETAGREFALWALRDLRRTGGRPSAALAAALRAQAAHTGLAPFVEKLLQGNPSPDLEDAIRGRRK